MPGTQNCQHLRRNSALGSKSVEPVLHHVQSFRTRSKLGCVLALALLGHLPPQGEPAHNGRQQRSLADQRDDDNSESHEENEIAVGKRRVRRAWLRIFVVRCGLPCDPRLGVIHAMEG